MSEAAPRPGYGLRLAQAQRLIDRHSPVGVVEVDWPAGRVRVSAYLGDVALPSEIPSRVRCLVTTQTEVLATWDVFGIADCFPGGGAEPGETITQTACREVLEETGWHIDANTINVLGWMHIYSYAEPGPDHPFPYPDGFMTVVHANPLRAEDGHHDWEDTEGFVTRSAFLPLAELPKAIRDGPIHGPFLDLVFGDLWRTPAG